MCPCSCVSEIFLSVVKDLRINHAPWSQKLEWTHALWKREQKQRQMPRLKR